MPLEPIHAIGRAHPVGLEPDPPIELLDGGGRSDVDKRLDTVQQLRPLRLVELLAGPRDRIDMTGRHRTVAQRLGETRAGDECSSAFGRLRRLANRGLRSLCDRRLGEAVDRRQLRHDCRSPRLHPRFDFASSHQPGLEIELRHGTVGAGTGEPLHPLEHCCDLHTDNHRDGVSQS